MVCYNFPHMISRRRLQILSQLVSLLVLPSLATAAEDPKPWADRVQRAYESVQNLQAGFTQVAYLKSAAKALAPSSGQLWLEKPGKMRWEFQKPDVKTFVSDGKTIWMYDADENQVLVSQNAGQSVTALNFLQGLGKLEKQFEVSVAEVPDGATDPRAEFLSLKPKSEDDIQLQEIVLGVDRKTDLAEEVTLVDQLGNRTHLAFHDISVNKGVAAKTFTFDVPRGAQVIDPSQKR